MVAPVSTLLLAAGLAGASAADLSSMFGFGGVWSHSRKKVDVQVDGPAPGEVSKLEKGTSAYISELRMRVLANTHKVLPLPWDIIEDRDVGYIGALDLLDEASTEAVETKLQTEREADGLNPMVQIVAFKMKDTDQPATPSWRVRIGEKAAKDILHLNGVVDPPAELTALQWQRIRWSNCGATRRITPCGSKEDDNRAGVKEWLEQAMTPHQNQMVVITSYGDVLHGGCAENIMLHKYREIIAASGGTQKIVLAAEVSPWPWSLGWRYSKTSWTATRRGSVMSELGVASDWAEAYADCNDTKAGPCNSPPMYQFANAGLMMGPAVEIYDMLSELSSYGGDENALVNEYYLKNPQLVTLDYAGSLFLSLHNLAKGGVTPVEVVPQDDTKVLFNKATNTKVCFVHGNGNGFEALKAIAVQQTVANDTADARRTYWSSWS